MGSEKENVVPFPCVLSTQMRPPCASTMPRAIASPSPVPFRSVRRACQNRSKTRGRCSGGMPGPASVTESHTSSPWTLARTVTGEPSGACFTALSSRFPSACTRRGRSRESAGSAPSGSTVTTSDFLVAATVESPTASAMTDGRSFDARASGNPPASIRVTSTRSWISRCMWLVARRMISRWRVHSGGASFLSSSHATWMLNRGLRSSCETTAIT
jgi:hypothetical protein